MQTADDYSGVSVDIQSTDLSNLMATVQLTFSANVGDYIWMGGSVGGAASAQADDATLQNLVSRFESGLTRESTGNEPAAGILYAAAGAIDFYNTAQMQIVLPEGYSIATSDPLASTVVTPVPASIWLFGSALFGVAGVIRKGARKVV